MEYGQAVTQYYVFRYVLQYDEGAATVILMKANFEKGLAFLNQHVQDCLEAQCNSF